MKIITDPHVLQKQCLAWKREGLTIALAPTMGYFHAGHISLMDKARSLADKVVVSLFVNPAQFGPGEDLASYPFDPDGDAVTAKAHGADILFTPSPGDMYPQGPAVWVEVPGLSSQLCGASRPTHFRGVSTVVAKLFMLSRADYAVFGQKDWQQLAVLRRMVKDLFIPVELVAMPIVREADGLALSSRNAYLTAEERAQAPHLAKGLALAQRLLNNGESSAQRLKEAVLQYWRTYLPLGREDYLSFVHPDDLAPVESLDCPALAVAAVHVGRARLIDNLLLIPKG